MAGSITSGSRLGVETAGEMRLSSEFDFASQAILYLPPRMPDPRSANFSMAAGHQVVELLKRSRGRAFVLFTSYASLRAVQAIAEMALDYPILVQGNGSPISGLDMVGIVSSAVRLSRSWEDLV